MPQRNKSKTRITGFTLIEVLLYSVLVSSFIGIGFLLISSIFSASDTLLERNEVLANQELVERKLEWLISQAGSVGVPAPNDSGAQLTLNGSGSLYPAVFSLDSEAVFLSTSGGTAKPITNNKVRAIQFLVEHFTSSQTSSTLRISLDLQSSIFSRINATSTLFYAIPAI